MSQVSKHHRCKILIQVLRQVKTVNADKADEEYGRDATEQLLTEEFMVETEQFGNRRYTIIDQKLPRLSKEQLFYILV